MATGYKKYMKKDIPQDYGLWKLFIISFFGMLLVFTFLIKTFSPTVDTSIGGDRPEIEADNSDEMKKVVDGRLAMIQDEDLGKNFSELMKQTEDERKVVESDENPKVDSVAEALKTEATDPVYKVYIGTYTTAEQAKVAKDIIVEGGSNLTPIVKCIGSNNYTLQVGIFKNKASAEGLLYTINQNNLPGRIVQEY